MVLLTMKAYENKYMYNVSIKLKVYIINNCKVKILTELVINKLLISTRTSQLRRKNR